MHRARGPREHACIHAVRARIYTRARVARANHAWPAGAHPAPPQNGQKWSAEKFKDMSGHQGEQAQHAG